MNTSKFEKKLRKINRLFDGVKEDGHISAIEKDLLKSYLQDAYEVLLDNGSNEKTEDKKPAQTAGKEPTHHVPPVIQPQSISKPVVDVAETVHKPETHIEVATPTAPTLDEVKVEVETLTVDAETNSALSDMFDSIGGNNDLSDRLAMSPISDISRAMGINERIFTVKELFGNDNEIFSMVVDRLNGFSSYDEAKAYLIDGVAKDQNWDHESKIKKAETFARLVRRRYA